MYKSYRKQRKVSILGSLQYFLWGFFLISILSYYLSFKYYKYAAINSKRIYKNRTILVQQR